MRYKQIKAGLPNGMETTIYIDKAYEEVSYNGETRKRVYLGDAIITETVGGADPGHKIGFVHRDRLGSVVTITDENGNVVENKSYDPFGKPRKGTMELVEPSTLKDVALASNFSLYTTNRGFTDHEHLDDAELIHMNGRVYDYNLGRFLSVDPFIQSPGNSQSMNPYSYIMNNPLAGTDPSGYVGESVCEGNTTGNCSTTWYDNTLVGGSNSEVTAFDNGNADFISTDTHDEIDAVIDYTGKTRSDNFESITIVGRGISRTGGTDRYNKNNSKVEEDEDSTNGDSTDPQDGSNQPSGRCASQGKCHPEDFSKAEQYEIQENLQTLTIQQREEGKFKNMREAAVGLHENEGLRNYAKELGIEVWAIIDKDGNIVKVSTGFNHSSALGAVENSRLGVGGAIWHTHPSGGDAHSGDLASLLNKNNFARNIYASGDRLSGYDLYSTGFSSINDYYRAVGTGKVIQKDIYENGKWSKLNENF